MVRSGASHRRIAGDAARPTEEERKMADNKSKRGSPDSKRLNKGEPYEVAYATSKRASPARKAMAGKSASAGKSGASARSGAKKTATRSGGSRAAPASGARARTSSSSTSAKSAAPAMKKTNAAPARKKAPPSRGTPHPPKAEKTPDNTAPRTMKEADAVDLLVDDHLQVGALFKQYEKLAKKEAAAGERRPLAQTICDMLKAHTTIEEEIFYPAARRAGIDADLLDEADIEHASAKELIAQIEGGNPDDDHYDARVTVLGEYIDHHVVEEHTEMFPKCRRSGMDLVALRAELEARKSELVPAGGAADVAPDAANESKAKSTGILATLFTKG
jgi:hypothetical protein